MPSPSAQADESEVIAAVRPASVFLYSPLSGESGSGFVVRSSRNGTYVLTAAHVIARTPDSPAAFSAYFNGDFNAPRHITVLRTDFAHDLALLLTPNQSAAQLAIGADPTTGMHVGVVGYPSATSLRLIRSTHELRSEYLGGVVTSVRDQARKLHLTTPALPGDSGAPVFDTENGRVIGMIRAHDDVGARGFGYEAVGARAIREFLHAAGVAYFGPSAEQGVRPGTDAGVPSSITGMQPLRNAPGAQRLLVSVVTMFQVKGTPPDGSVNSPNMVASSALNARGQLAELFHAQAIPGQSYQVSTGQSIPSPQELAVQLPGNDAVAGIRLLYAWDINAPTSNTSTASTPSRGFFGGLLRNLDQLSQGMGSYDALVAASAIDRYGDVVFSGEAMQKPRVTSATSLAANLGAAFNDLTDQVLREIATQAALNGPNTAVNFARFGIPLATGQRSAFFWIDSQPGYARIKGLYPYGTAANAHLQVDDHIIALDGNDLTGLKPDQIQKLFDSASQHLYRCVIEQPDGQPVTITFPPEDIRWYLHHPSAIR